MKPRIIALIVLALVISSAIMMHGQDDEPASQHDESPTDISTAGALAGDAGIGTTTDVRIVSDAPESVFGCTIDSFETAEPDKLAGLTIAESVRIAEQRRDAFLERLAVSDDLNHRLALGVAQVGRESSRAIDTLAPLLTAMPDNEILHWRLLEACAMRPRHPDCADGRAEERTLAVLGSNGELWAKVAYFRAENGDGDGALEALLNSVAAAEFESFWGAEVDLLFDSLGIESDLSAVDRLADAMSISASAIGPEFQLIGHCRDYGADSAAWRDACIAYGLRKENDSDMLLGRGLGFGIQIAMHTLNDDEAAAEAVEQREKRIMDPILRGPSGHDRELLLLTDESIALAWLQHLRTYGEISALEFLNAEVERVSQIPGYDPCPPREPQM